MTTIFSRFLTKYKTTTLFQKSVVNRSIFAFLSGITHAFKAVNRRALSAIGTTIMLSTLLSACAGGGGSDVSAPTAPTFSVASSNFSIDEDFATIQLVASVSNATSMTVSQSNTGVVTVTTSNSQVNVSSISNANGRTILTIRAANGTLIATTQVTVTVNAVNDPPTLAVSSNNISTVSGFSPITINITASDVEDTNLTFTVAESTTGVVRVGTSANAIILSNIPNVSGQTTLTITAVDSSGSTVTQTIVVSVFNRAPVLRVSTTLISLQEDFMALVAFRITATDLDGNTITLSVSSATRLVDAAISTLTNGVSGITLSAIANANGTRTLTVQATAAGQSASTNVVVVVVPINDPPTIAVSSKSISTVGGFSPITINTTASDIEDGTLPFTVSDSNPGVVRLTTSANAITLNAISGVSSQTILTVRTADRTGTTVTRTISVNVINTTPVLTVSTTHISLQEDFTALVIFGITATDLDGDALTFSLSSTTRLVDAAISTLTMSTISLSANANAHGTTTLIIQAMDAVGQSVSRNVVVVVTAVNDTPTLTIPNVNLVVAEDFSGNSTIATAADIDGDTPIINVVESTTGLIKVTTSTSGVSISNRPHANGVTTLTITVSDGLLSSTAQVVVTVTEVNDPPILNIPNATLTRVEDFVGGITVAAASDVDGNSLTFSVIESTTGVIRVTVSTSDVRISSRGNANGMTTLSISVSDGSTASSTAQVVVTVTPVNDPPVLSVSTDSLTLAEDFATTEVLTVTRSDVDGDTLTLTVSESTTGVVSVSTSSVGIQVISIADANGQTTLTITVGDGTDSVSTQVRVTVNAVNDPPILSVSQDALTLNEDFSTTEVITVTSSDVDGDTLTLTVSESTTGVVTVTTSASGFRVVSILNVNGPTTLTVRVTDLDGLFASTDVIVVVNEINDPPVLSVSPDALTLNEDFVTTEVITVISSDVDGDTLTLTVSESTTGVVSVSTSSVGIQVISIADANGQTTLTITVGDGTASVSTHVLVTVNAVNDPPILSVSPDALTLNEDFVTTEVITVTNSDVDGDTLTLTVSESTTGVITVTTLASGVQVVSILNANGQTTLTITVGDGTASVSTRVLVTVNAVNDPPILSVLQNALTLNEDFSTTEVLTVTRSDVDGDTLTLTVSESTTGVVSLSTSSAGIQVVSNADANGQTTLTITVGDGTASVSTRVLVTVNAVNDPPVISVSTASLILAEDFATTEVLTVISSDADGDTLTLTVSESTTGVVSVSTSSAGVQVISIADANGQTTLIITVGDGTASVSSQVLITVNAVNDPPVLSVSQDALTLNEDFSTTEVLTVTSSDVDGDTLALTVSESTTGVVTVTTSASGFQVVSILNANGQTTLTITVGDGTASVSTQVLITVNAVNDPPVLSVSQNALTLNEDFSTTEVITVTSSDVDGDTLTLTVSESTTGVVSVSTSSAGVQVISIADANGQTTLTITVGDGTASVSTQVLITVNAVNDPPVLSVLQNALTLNEDFSTTEVITVTSSDVDGDTLTLTVSESTTGVVSVSTSSAGIQVVSNADANGQTTLTITVGDGTASVSTHVLVTVNAVNDPPVISVSTASLILAEDFATTEVLTVISSDVDGNTLTLTVSESTTGVVSVSTSSAGVQVISIADANGQTTLIITVGDGTASVSSQVLVTVNAINDPPVLSVSQDALTLNEDFSTTEVLIVTRTDVDSDTLALTVSESTTGVVTVTTSASGFQVVSILNANGQTTLTITVGDGTASVSTHVLITVNAVNDPPVLSVSQDALTLNEDFSTTEVITVTSSDVDGDTLALTVSESTTGVVSVSTSSTDIQVVSIADANGQTTLTITVGDGRASVSTQVLVTVNAVNDPPVLSVLQNALTLNEDFSTTEVIIVTSSDVDGDTLTLTVSESTTGVVSVSTSSTGIQVVSIADANGQTTLTITVGDGTASVSTHVLVTVNAVNDPPVLSVSPDALTLNEDFSTTEVITVTSNDVDGDTLTLTVSESTTGVVTVTTSTLGFQVVSILNANGPTTLTITVGDGRASVSTQVLVTVNAVNDPPTLTVSSNSISTVGGFSPITINTTASDIEDANISFTVLGANTGVVRVTTSTNAIVLNTVSGASGQTSLTVRVVDSSGAMVAEIITVNVSIRPSVATPVVTISTNLISVQEDFRTPVIIQTTVTDADGDTITVSVSASMPFLNAVISTPVNRQSTITNSITLTAIADANGTATLTVLAADSGGQSQSTEIVVVVSSVEDTPTLTIPSTTLTVAEDFASTLTIATASDADGDTLLISVVESTTGIVTVTTTALEVSVSNILNANGQSTLTITVNDGTQDTTAQVVVTVTPVNDPPTLIIPTATLTAMEDFAGGITVATASDVDGNPLTFSVDQSTTDVIRVTTSTSEVRISSRGGTNGVTTLSISVSDGTASSTAQMVVTVTAVNDPPTLSVTTTALILNEDFATVLIGATRNDIDSNTLTLTVAESATGVVTVTITDAGVQVVNITDTNGVTTLTISLSDGELTTSAQVVITVTPVNDSPSLSVSTIALTLNEDFSTTEVLTVTSSDVDGDTLTLTVSESTTGVVTVTTAVSGFSVSSILNANGQTTLTITLSDGRLSTTTQVVVDVTAVNDPPVLTVSTNALTLAEDFASTLTIATATDVDGDTLTLTVSESTTGVVSVSTSSVGVQVISIVNANGQTTLTITVGDGRDSVSTQVLVTVNAINDPPVLSVSTNALTLAEDFSTTEVLTVTSSDVDSSTLTLTVVESATGVVTVTTAVSGFSVSSILNANGQTTLTITLSDGRLSTTTQVVVDVTAVNDPPVLIVSTDALTLAEDFATTEVITVTSSDVDGDTLTLTVSESTTGVVSVSTSSIGVQVVSIANANGQTTLTITVGDGTDSVSTQVLVTVNAVNDPPVLTASTNALTLAEDFATTEVITITRSDIDSSTLTLTVVESATGVVSVSTSSIGVQVVSIANANGQTTLTITVGDGTDSVSTQVLVTVNAVNDPPVLSVTQNALTLNEDFSTTEVLTVTRSDVDGDTLTLTVSESTTGVITVTTLASGVQVVSILNANGRTTLTITVGDGTASVSTQVLVTVNAVNDPPVLIVSTNALTLAEDFATTEVITITRSDIDSSTLTLTVVESATGVVSVSTSSVGVQVISIANANGQTTLTITVSDGTDSVSTQILVTVNAVNDPPVLTVSTNALTLAEDFATTELITVISSDVDGDTLTLTVSESTTGVITVTTSASGVQVASILNANGRTTLTITVGDGTASVSTQVLVTVNAVNDPPVLSASTNALTLAEDFSTTEVITITRSDIDSSTLTLTVVESATGVVSVSTSSIGVQVVSIADANGQTTLTITVGDGKASVSTQVLVTVNAVNDPPVLTVSTNALTLAEDFATTELITVISSDVDGDTLTLTVSESTTGVVTVTTAVSGVSVSSILNANGQTTLTVQVTDGDGLLASTDVMVVVNAVNDPPVLIVSTTALTLAEDFTTTEVLTITRSDIDSSTLTLTVVESATGVVSVSTSSVGVQVISIANANGQTTLTITVGDGTASVSTQILVTVNAVNDPPVLTVSTNALTLAEDFATTELITVISSDVDGDTLTLTVSESTTGVITVTTSASGVQVASILNANGRTTLTVKVTDGDGLLASTDVMVVVNAVNDPPVLIVSTNLILVDEDFTNPVVIRTTATDADGDVLIVTSSSSSRLVDAVLSTPVNGVSTITNMITLTAMTNFNGTTTLTVQAIDGGGIATTQQIVVVVNAVDDPVPFTLPTSAVSLFVPGSQLDRIVNAISISNPDNKTLRAQIGVTASGDNIFSANPAPMVSFTTNALITTATLTSATSTAQLYFTIRPDRTGTATLVVLLTDLDTLITTQQTMVVQVNSVNVPPVIAQYSSNLADYVIYGSQIYANSTQYVVPLNPLLTEARALGGQLINFNSDEEYQFILGAAIVTHNTWWGLVLPQPIFPGELFWITHDSTIAYGFATGNGLGNLTVYPGHYPLPWNAGGGVAANRGGNALNINGTVYSISAFLFLLQDVGDGSDRRALYEFPQGLPPIASNSTPIMVISSATVQLTGYDLNGTDTINTSNWSGTDFNGGSVDFTPATATTFLGLHSVNMTYTPLPNIGGQTRVVVTLTVDGLSTTAAITFMLPPLPVPTIALSTNVIMLDEDFGTFDIATTATEQGFSTSLPFSVQASTSGIVTITTSANNIQLSAVSNVSGMVTLTVRTTDSASFANSTQVVVTVRSVNDTPTVTVSSDSISILGGFAPITIYTTATDVESGTLVVTVSSTTHLVNTVISTHSITLSSLPNIFGTTTLTVRARDDGGLFVSTELIVIVESANDTPTLTVSANMVTLGSTPFVVNVTATDVEDSTLSFSVSGGQGFVNTVITTTSLSISRIGVMLFQVVLSLRTTDTAGASVSTNITVVGRPVLGVTTGIKTLKFAWDAISSATYYRLRSNPDGGSGFPDLSTRGVVVSPNSTNISQTSAQALVSLHRYIPNVTNPQYGVDSCDATSCGTSFRHDTVTLNKAQLDSMIGRLLASNAGGDDRFGSAISLSGDGNTLAVGASNEDSNGAGINGEQGNNILGVSGAVYLFRRNGGVWTQQAYIKASNSAANAQFGQSVSLSDDGHTLAVGADSEPGTATGVDASQSSAIGEGIGAAYVFRFSTNTNAWTQQSYIKASNAGTNDNFGQSVSLSNDGNTLAVGANLEDGSTNNSTDTGAVYVFRFSSSTWAEQAYLKASNPGTIDQFGNEVNLSGDGNTLAVGAHDEDGSSTGVNGADSDTARDSGAAYVFRFSTNTNTWVHQAYFKPSNFGTLAGIAFGRSVSLSDDGNTLAVGANSEDSDGTRGSDGSLNYNNFSPDSGAAYVFRFSTNTNTWANQSYLKASNTLSNADFGSSVSLSGDGNALAVGAQVRRGIVGQIGGLAGPENTLTNSGAAYVFEYGNGSWVQQAYIRASDPVIGALFGRSVSLSSDGQTLAVGAPFANRISDDGTNIFGTGAVYLY